ncbi:MAG: site-specific DNA-methyltransferase [Anaerolineae bacterium]|nr:site-specific DNA-methyltransferase [Anaerolineae bacterium]
MPDHHENRAPRNRTIRLSEAERAHYAARLIRLDIPAALATVIDRTICQDALAALPLLPAACVDLAFADPPYNLGKTFGAATFGPLPPDEYAAWLESWLAPLVRVLKPTASLYVCSDWRASGVVQAALARHFVVRNRITWEREKGRGALSNWKNAHEDIWFCTVGDDYSFDVDAVKLRRRVRAPYTDAVGQPKDWRERDGGRFRLTHPSNLWTDLTVPFWSMPENTDHPTQKPEKLLAKVILASSRPGDLVLDPFLGSGTCSVVAEKLDRHYIGIEIDAAFCCLAEKRLALAEGNRRIQGYADGVFWERNSGPRR